MIHPQTFYIETYGCTFNQADSTKITNILLQENFRLSPQNHAEFIIINTCAVKSQTEAKILHRIKTISLHQNQKLLITGCLPWISETLLNQIKGINPHIWIIFDCNSLNDLIKILKSANTSEPHILKSAKSIDKSKISPLNNDPTKPGIIQISEGCSNSCTYCCTHISRGKAIYYPLTEILSQISAFVNQGTKEIYLTAQDCGEYDWDSNSIVDLVQKIADKFTQKEIFIRIGMIHPKHHRKILELAKIIRRSSIFYKFLHIPIQSASNKILKLMKRGYTKQSISEMFDKIQENNITISTDIICGFPEETEQDFWETYQFIEKYQPDIINISKYTTRPGTDAKMMKQVNSAIVKERTQQMTKLYLDYIAKKNLRWKGWKGKVLIRGHQQQKAYQYSGRTEFYKSIVLLEGSINSFEKASILKSTSQYLIGEVLNDDVFFEN